MPSPNSNGTKGAVSTAYLDDSARHYDELRFATSGGRAIHEIEAQMLWTGVQALPPGSRILDVGCGTGRFLVDIVAAGHRGEGLDASPDMLEVSRAKLLARGFTAPLHLGECGRLPFPDGTFDFVYCIRVLNQTESRAYALSVVPELLRVTRPGGQVLVEFISAQRPRVRPRKDVRLSIDDVTAATERAGGQVEWVRGAFFFGMTGQLLAAGRARRALSALDRALARRWPRLSGRCYALLTRLPVARGS